MALRLAGEEYTVVQGLDDQGYLRDIKANDPDPGLIVDQQGAGAILSLRDNGVVRLLQADGGNVLLANAASPPSSPDALLHLWTGSAGVVTAPTTALLVLEHSGDVGLALLSGNTSGGILQFGDDGDNDNGRIIYRHGATPEFGFNVNGVEQMVWREGGVDYKVATTIKTSAGDLTLEPAGDIKGRPTTGALVSKNASPPSSPDALLHLWTGSAGVVTAPTTALLVLEHSGDVGLALLSGNTSGGILQFGDDGDNDNGRIIYRHGATPEFGFDVNGVAQMAWQEGSVDYKVEVDPISWTGLGRN